MPDILIPEKITGRPIDELHDHFTVHAAADLWQDPAALTAAAADCRALIVRNQTQVTADLIAAAPNLKIIARAGVGLDNIDVPAATQAGIVVSFTPDQNAISVAELTFGFMIGLSRNIAPADKSTKAGRWDRHRFWGTELFAKTLGVVGLGRIGFLVALRARAFGMHIVAHDPYINPDTPPVTETGARLVSLDELLEQADYVTCHVPATEQTRHMFAADQFEKMKPTAYLINIARGELIDEPALIEALTSRQIAGAALDVRADEPPTPSPLSDLPNVILTPHIGALTDEAQNRVLKALAADVQAVLNGRRAKNAAN